MPMTTGMICEEDPAVAKALFLQLLAELPGQVAQVQPRGRVFLDQLERGEVGSQGGRRQAGGIDQGTAGVDEIIDQ